MLAFGGGGGGGTGREGVKIARWRRVHGDCWGEVTEGGGALHPEIVSPKQFW